MTFVSIFYLFPIQSFSLLYKYYLKLFDIKSFLTILTLKLGALLFLIIDYNISIWNIQDDWSILNLYKNFTLYEIERKENKK